MIKHAYDIITAFRNIFQRRTITSASTSNEIYKDIKSYQRQAIREFQMCSFTATTGIGFKRHQFISTTSKSTNFKGAQSHQQ